MPMSYRIHRILSKLVILSMILSLLPPSLLAAAARDRSPADVMVASAEPLSPAARRSPAAEPDVLANPVSLSRVQSAYTAGTTVISFSVTNNLLPTLLPDLPPSAPITDTLEILAGFSLSADANTLKNGVLVETLTPGTSFLEASGDYTLAGSTVTWNLQDLPPQASTVLSLTVQTPPAGVGFVDLDQGAEVTFERWGSPVAVTATSAVLIPTGLDPALTMPTPDADVYDAEMLWKAASFGQEPLAMFAYVQTFSFDPYHGSLRGTRGTLWGEAGNAVDRSSLLIAMLRASGIPARYRHGTLSNVTAQSLLAEGFNPAAGLAGSVPAGAPVADPLNDPDLLALAADHWWVEAYLPGSGWTDLDPSFPSAGPGDVFVASTATDGTDRIASLPVDQQHTISVRLKVEQYSAFPISGANLVESYPLEVTFPTAQVAGKRLTFAHFVASEGQGGVFSNVIHTYTPYFLIEENNIAYEGDPFQDFISNFPLSSEFTTAEWVEYEITDPDGNSESFTRTVKDLIGADARLSGGALSLTADLNSRPFALLDDLYVNWVLPNKVTDWAHTRWTLGLLPRMVEIAQHGQEMLVIAASGGPNDELTPEQIAAFSAARTQVVFSSERLLTDIGLDFAWQADRTLSAIETGLQTKLYYDSPRVFTVASVGDPTVAVTSTVDLRRTTARAIVYPDQAETAEFTAQWVKGLAESNLEGQVLEAVEGGLALTTWRIFDEMEVQGIPPVLLSPDDLDQLDIYPFSSLTQAYVATALAAGQSVLIPSEPVNIDGEEVFAWWEIDPETGETVSVGEDGLHTAALSYRIVVLIVEAGIEAYSAGSNPLSPPGAASVAESAQIIGEKLAAIFENLLETWESAMSRESARVGFDESAWRAQPAHRCPVDNCAAEQFFIAGLGEADIPLPEMAFVYGPGEADHPIARSTVFVNATLPGGSPTFNLLASPAASSTTPDVPVNFQAEISSNFDDDFILMAYAPVGWAVTLDPAGSVSVQPAAGAAPDDYTIQLVAQSLLYPDLVAAAEHIVTIQALEVMELSLALEPDITVPMGTAQIQAVSNQTNDGEAEIPGVAYTVVLSNTATTAHTYDISVSGPPAGWVILNGAVQTAVSVDLEPGETAALGLYLQPPPGAVPAPGASYPVNVTATAVGNPALTDSEGAIFNMPGQAFNYATTAPTTLFVEAGGSVDFDLQVENVGNASGTFPITTYTPVSGVSVSGLPVSVNLGIGGSTTDQGTLAVTGLTPGIRFPLEIASPAPASYTQYALVDVQIISALTGPVFNAADHIGTSCPLGEPGLSAALESLGYTMVQLENACSAGSCPLSLRDQVVDAVDTTAYYSGAISSLVAAADTLNSLAADLASHTDDTAILADLAAISTAVTDLETEVCELSEHLPELTWAPGYDAILPGGTSEYTLTLTNLGSMSTLYTLTVDLPAGSQTLTPTVAPGASVDFVYPITESVLGLYELSAAAEAGGPDVTLPGLVVEAMARLGVVDRFLQLTAVRPDPAFVETGTSATTIYIDVSNVANLGWEANAQITILYPAGGTSYTADYPVNILLGAPRTYTLGTVDTSGWAAGVYTVSVELLDTNLDLIPDGSGYGYFGVGQGLGVSHDISPTIVPPGTVTVTTQITTELLSESIVPMRGSGELESGRVDESTNQRVNDSSDPSNGEASEPERIADSAESLILTTWAITRTEDTSPAIIYSGTWATQTSPQFSDQASNVDYTYSSIAGDTASFDFTGAWVHIGFIASQEAGNAEILIDGVSYGAVDLYGPNFNSAADVASFSFEGLPDSAHTLTIRVTGTSNPFATGQLVKLDYIDTWDGTLMPDGSFEEDSGRIWYSDDWDFPSDPVASGGGYAKKGFQGNPTAWFPFTGDTFTYQAVANTAGGIARLLVDGQPLTMLDLYSTDTVTNTYSFNGFGAGPHVLTLRHFLSDITIDALSTPGSPPYYQEPAYTGIVRYEEYDPAIRYSGADYFHRPRTWAASSTGGTSGLADLNTSTMSNTIGLTFDGRWVSIGVRAGNNRGQAEVFVDGASQGIIGLYAPSETLTSFQFGDFLTGTHTLTLTVLGQPDPPSAGSSIYLDYIDVWDGTALPDGYVNVQRSEPSGRLHYSAGGVDVDDSNALQGDYLATTLPNNNVNVWYAFTGDSFTYLAFSRLSGATVEVYVDGELLDTINPVYPFSQQPLAFHYTGFSDGPHVVRVHNVFNMRVDAFASNPSSLASYQPLVEWYDNISGGASLWGGLHIPVAVGDVTGDGEVELVVASSDVNNSGTLFLMRGDGEDTGDGDPIIWSIPYNIFNGFEDVAAPTIAELDGQPGAEIIHSTIEGVYVYHSDGSTYWMTDTLHSHVFFASPAVGNLDLDPDPEIAINLSDSLAVFEHDGTLAWSRPTVGTPSMPLLADLTGDGLLDILFQDGDTLNLYDYNDGSPVLAWAQTFTTSLGVYGAGAVADIDGLQPGGDPGPEIAISSDGWTHVLDADGSFIWSTPLDPGNPGGVSIADLDGDGEVELVTTMLYNGGRIYALNADGSVLWDVEALDNSSLTASVMDLDGDGIYEVAWNGATGGFTLFNGADGAVLFNEPHPDVISQTGSDYPVFADVDLDGYAEVVVASQRGVRVFGFDTVWGPARPLWNQHSYHITNINDDLSVPTNELNSWEIHNTYRTQTPLTNPLPSYDVVLTHTVGITGVMVLSGTFNVVPDFAADPAYGWSYTQEAGDPVVVRFFQSRLDNLLPGEARLAALGTEVFYTLPGGSNRLNLPGLYVTAPHLISLDPYSQAVGSGAAAAYTVTLTNPAPDSSLYTLSVAGLPADWVTVPSPVNVPGGSSVPVALTVNVPPPAAAAPYAFSVGVTTDLGGADQATGLLDVLGPLAALQITPPEQAALAGEVVTFTLALTNFEAVDRTFTLTGTGLAEIDLPASLSVLAGAVVSLDFTALAGAPGPNPFTIRATAAGSAAEDTAVLNAGGLSQVDVAIEPAAAPGGPGAQTVFAVTVTNLGTEAETFDLAVTVPNGWGYALARNGVTVTEVTLLPAIFNAIELQLIVTPDVAAVQGDYPVRVLAESQTGGQEGADAPASSGSGTATVQVGSRGVQVEVLSGPAVLAPSDTGVWQIQVTNTGSLADTYDLSAFGFIGPYAQFSPGTISLDPGQSQTVQMTASGFLHALAREYTIGVLAQSQADSAIRSQDTTSVTISAAEAVAVAWRPASQQVDGILSAAFTFDVSNLGNASAVYQFFVSSSPAATVSVSPLSLPIPPRTTISLRVTVGVPGEGVYLLTGTADGPAAQDSATATLTVGEVSQTLYLPLIQKE